MKNALLGMTAAVFALAMISTDALAAGNKNAAGEKKAPPTVVSGLLAVVKNDKGEITEATISTKSGTVYSLSMEGLAQAVKELDGKEVTAKGEVKDEAGKMILNVKGRITLASEKKAGKGKKN